MNVESSSHSQACPNCNVSLTEVPKRKKKCPHCGEYIYIRNAPGTNKTVFVTEFEAEKIDKEWANIYRRKDYVDRLWGYDITESDFEERKKLLAKDSEMEIDDKYVLWSFFNELTLRFGEKLDYPQLAILYHKKALFLDEEGKDYKNALNESNKANLLNFKTTGIKKVKILTAGDQSCSACQKLSDKVFLVGEALKTMPLPCKECTHSIYSDNPGFCRCEYIAEIDIDDYLEDF